MAIAGAIAIGILISIAFYCFIIEFKNITMLNRIGGILFLLMSLYCCSLYFLSMSSWIWALFGLMVGLICRVFFVKTKLHFIIENAFEHKTECEYEEDFMNTKKGKIVMIIVILLVIYSIVSTACIYRLNQKINSMVVITDELREEIAR